MKSLRKIKWKHYINYIAVGIVLIVFATMSMTLPRGLDRSIVILLEKISISVMLAVSLSLVVGFLGELSLGHAGFMCVGAYLGGKASVILEPLLGKDSPLMLIASLAVGGIIAALFGVIIGIPALRLKGDYLAIVTLAFGEITKTLFQNSSDETFGGSLGLETPRFDRNQLFIYAFILILIMLFVIQNLMRSRHGRAITAIRDNEIAARATGINVTKYKLIAFTVSAFFAGIAGVLDSFTKYNIQADSFDYNYSIEILIMVVLGGMGNITGSIVAATLITYINTEFADIFKGDLAELRNLVYAFILIVIVVYRNAPVLKGFREKYNFKKLVAKLKRKPHDPSYIHDDEAEWAKIPTKISMDEILSVDVAPAKHSSTLRPDKPKGKEE